MALVPTSEKSAFGQSVWLLVYDRISMPALGRLIGGVDQKIGRMRKEYCRGFGDHSAWILIVSWPSS
jgi:hypothetical protein